MEPTDSTRRPPEIRFPMTNRQCTVAALVHFIILIPGWGLLGAFYIWHTRREEHPEIRFQAAQAIYWQSIWLLSATFFILCNFFFDLLAELNLRLSENLINLNVYLFMGITVVMALLALWGGFATRWWGRWHYPVLGAALRREIHRAEVADQQQADQ